MLLKQYISTILIKKTSTFLVFFQYLVAEYRELKKRVLVEVIFFLDDSPSPLGEKA
jgi:hypothetical protein